jgi:hypothetical protein
MISAHLFLRSPGGENEGSSVTADNNDDKTSGNEPSADLTEKSTHKKNIIEKVRDALQDWSNADRHDQAFDDTRP